MDRETGTAVPLAPVTARITLRQHQVIQDKPQDLGGTDEGPMASELLLASLLACQLSTFAKVAAKRRSTASIRSLEGALRFDERGDIDRIELDFQLAGTDGLTDSNVQALLRLTDKTCTISRALHAPVTSRYSKV